MNIQERIEQLYNEAHALGLQEIERLARKILNRYEDLDEFIMCMGMWFFPSEKYDVNFSSDITGVSFYIGDSDEEEEVEFDFSELEDFITKWDRDFHFTGSSMRFTKDGEIIEHW